MEFETLVQQKIGEASMCWHTTPKGIFDSDRASAIAIDVVNAHNKELELLENNFNIAKKNTSSVTREFIWLNLCTGKIIINDNDWTNGMWRRECQDEYFFIGLL